MDNSSRSRPGRELHPLLTVAVRIRVVVFFVVLAMVAVDIVRPAVITPWSTASVVQSRVIRPTLLGTAAQLLR